MLLSLFLTLPIYGLQTDQGGMHVISRMRVLGMDLNF